MTCQERDQVFNIIAQTRKIMLGLVKCVKIALGKTTQTIIWSCPQVVQRDCLHFFV